MAEASIRTAMAALAGRLRHKSRLKPAANETSIKSGNFPYPWNVTEESDQEVTYCVI